MASWTLLRIIQLIKRRSFTFVPPRADIGERVFFGNNVFLDPMADGALITIGDDSTITNGVAVLVHDASSYRRTGLTYVAPVTIGRRVFIGLNAVVLPGVTIGDDAIIGAGSVVTRDVEAGTVVAGVPAERVTTTPALDRTRVERSLEVEVLDSATYDGRHPMERERIERMIASAKRNGSLFIGTRKKGP